MQPPSPLLSRHYAAIFMVALSVIVLQIISGRILSVIFYYHYAFAGITLAMLGMTAGALKVYARPERYAAAQLDRLLAFHMSRFALLMVGGALLLIAMPFWIYTMFGESNDLLGMSAGLLVLLWAFIDSGICVTLLLTRFPAQTSRLYAFDLVGAALGCIVVILALKTFDPIGALLILAAVIAWQGLRLLPHDASDGLRRCLRIIPILLALVSVLQVTTYLKGEPFVSVFYAKQHVLKPPLFERWNTYSRIDVTEKGLKPIFGWGFGSEHKQLIEQKAVTIDADAGTVMTKFDGDLKPINFLKDDIINLAYHTRDIDHVAVIGVGGGRDILSGLVFGADHIQGIEINPAIYEALTDTFGEFTGHLDKMPQVALANAEARSFLNSQQAQYDLIQISLIDTWATTAAGGLTLTENKLYTVNAWDDFLNRLSGKGFLSLSRWYDSNIHKGELYRMLTIAAETVKSRDPDANPRDYVLVANVHSIVTLMLSKSKLTPSDVKRFMAACREHHFTPLLTPDIAKDEMMATLISGRHSNAFFDELPFDLTPSTDDRPFFFNMMRMSDFLLGRHVDDTANINNNKAVRTLTYLTGLTLLAMVAFIGPNLFKLYRQHQPNLRQSSAYLLYFLSIGMGFMLIEISQMQRLIIFLGHPVYGLSVVLFTLLLASGLGSATVKPGEAPRVMALRTAVLLLVLVVTGLMTPMVTEHLKYYDTIVRIICSALLLMPMGFFLGMMFPIGVALSSRQHEALLPWFWGINGAASVFASVVSLSFSVAWGITATFWIGVAFYAVCLAIIRCKKAVA